MDKSNKAEAKMQQQSLSESDIKALFDKQKNKRWVVANSSCEERLEKLRLLKSSVLKYTAEIQQALYLDFKKPYRETEITEILPALEEINIALSHLSSWMKPQKIKTPLTLFGGKYQLQNQARGQCLILSPWNYPFQLTMAPLVAAIAAGNCVILKPSEKTPHISRLMKMILDEIFKSDEICLLLDEKPDATLAKVLLELPFDHIFFTGSTAVGKVVMAAAAKNLSTVTLELGGKSPCIVSRHADLDQAAQRICWGKFLNAGQTCVAPDYLLLEDSVADAFIEKLKNKIHNFYGPNSQEQMACKDFARIVDKNHWLRLKNLYAQTILNNKVKIVCGGDFLETDHYISPTVLDHVATDSPIMADEIFGPLLPIIRYRKIDEAITYIQSHPQPLALYIFTENQNEAQLVKTQTTSGGFVQNHLIIHLANPHAPFGGVGPSGQGCYHGYYGFKEFSHQRTCLKEPSKRSTSQLLFPPYSSKSMDFILKFMRKFVG